MIALDQMDGGRLDARSVAGLLASGEPTLKETASWIVGRHPEWAGELAGVLGARLARADLAAAERAELERQLGRFAEAAPIQRLLAERLAILRRRPRSGLSCLAAMSQSGLKPGKVPREWVAALAIRPGRRRRPIRRCRSDRRGRGGRAQPADRPPTATEPAPWPPACSRIAADAANPTGLRLDALAAVPGGLDKPDHEALRLLDRPDRPRQAGGGPHDRGRHPARARLAPGQLDPPGRRDRGRRAGGGRPPADRIRAVDRRGPRPEAGRRPVPLAGPDEPEARRARRPTWRSTARGPVAGRGATLLRGSTPTRPGRRRSSTG